MCQRLAPKPLWRPIVLKTKISVIVWNEYQHERENEAVRAIYPDGLHTVIAAALAETPGLLPGALPLEISTATLDQPEHGLSEERLAGCDVLVWWGHKAHDQVADVVVERVQRRVLEGMGLIVLHSGHFAKIFRRLLGTNCSLKWREADEKERVWVVEPSHPIAAGLGEFFELPNEEMYGERFDIPQPDSTVFISWFEGGEVFRSGCCWERGHGRIFYFRPGHEAYPTYHDANVQRVLANAVQWAAPRVNIVDSCPMSPPLEKLSDKKVTFSKVGILQGKGDIQ
ncbi:MAG TPA: ThuA domain-containing protein [Ideonella sp.]|jgi:trehalose utilization protein|nr:ThuA domain-containing protein [Ideonella sp.]